MPSLLDTFIIFVCVAALYLRSLLREPTLLVFEGDPASKENVQKTLGFYCRAKIWSWNIFTTTLAFLSAEIVLDEFPKCKNEFLLAIAGFILVVALTLVIVLAVIGALWAIDKVSLKVSKWRVPCIK